MSKGNRRAVLVLSLLAVWRPPSARADGAFPDSQSVMTPASQPQQILLATNFGVVLSFDNGRTWSWTCEQTLNSYATLYQVGPPPLNRLYALSPAGLVFSDDGSCSWSAASGVPPGSSVLDAFPDPSNADRVLAIVARTNDAGVLFQVVESTDAGKTFGANLYTAAGGDNLTGVEIAASAPSTVYLTMTSGPSFAPKLVQSTDGGTTWQVHDLSAGLAIATNSVRIMAVDPQNSEKVFLRVGSAAGEAVAVASEGGGAVTTPLTFPGGIVSAFTRAADGTIVVGGVVGVANVAFRSRDEGATFQPLPAPPSLHALSSRAGLLYAAVADNDDYDGDAIETSDDEGMTWQPFMQFAQIGAIQTCVKTQCQVDCLARAQNGQWSQDFCSATAESPPLDAGADGTAGAGSHTVDASSARIDASPAPAMSTAGCHCEAAPPPRSPWPSAATASALAMAAAFVLRHRRPAVRWRRFSAVQVRRKRRRSRYAGQ